MTVFYIFLSALAAAVLTQTLHPMSDEYIDLINQKQSSWTAGRNFHPETPIEYIIGLLGLKESDRTYNIPRVVHDEDLIASLPEHFDARERWPQCPSFKEIRDQGSCGSCWAIAGVEAMTDRVCVFSNGTQHVHFSTEDVISCAVGGCYGGWIGEAWFYWLEKGIVSGGEYGSNEGCQPYEIPPCTPHIPNCTHYRQTPDCKQSCRKGYNVSYSKDKRRGSHSYAVAGEQNMMAEIFVNGSIEAGMDIYLDFAHYKNNVYVSTKDKYLGGHAVKILGWGVENGLKYWLVANSWNKVWGDQGFFKILRGENHCGIELPNVAGIPLL